MSGTGTLLLLAALAALAAGVALFVQIRRLHELLESEYPHDYAPFQSIWGEGFNQVIRFIRSGRHTEIGDPELEGLCRSVQKLYVSFAWLVALAGFIGMYDEMDMSIWLEMLRRR